MDHHPSLPSAFDDDVEVPAVRPELPPTLRERWQQGRKTVAYRLTDVPPWAHRPVALTILCALVAAVAVAGSNYGFQRWERGRINTATVTAPTSPGLLVGIAAGFASSGELPQVTPPPAGTINVHVAGEVLLHGMVTLPTGSRAVDAVKAAGGATELADLDQVNLARLVVDGDQVLVPPIPTPDAAPAASAAGQPPTTGQQAGPDTAPSDTALDTAPSDTVASGAVEAESSDPTQPAVETGDP